MGIDDELRRALKPVDPGPDFTTRVLAAVVADREGTNTRPHDDGHVPFPAPRSSAWRRKAWLWPALAASLIGAVVGARWVEDRREAERGQQARLQVMQALRLTTDKLNLAREVVAPRP